MDVLRAHRSKENAIFGPLLRGLHPIASPRERRPFGVYYRLVVGPLPNVAAAMGICARFAAARAACLPAGFEGEQLAQRLR
jgi:hypothetical protein